VTYVYVALAGATLGFLRYNRFPAKNSYQHDNHSSIFVQLDRKGKSNDSQQHSDKVKEENRLPLVQAYVEQPVVQVLFISRGKSSLPQVAAHDRQD